MDARNEIVDSGQPLDERRLLELGHLVLQSLAAEARAAHAESQKAELEVAISKATQGSPEVLRNWLASYQLGTAEPRPAPVHAPPARASETAFNPAFVQLSDVVSEADDSSIPPLELPRTALSWNQLLPHARTRLADSAKSLEPPPATELEVLPTDFSPARPTAEVDLATDNFNDTSADAMERRDSPKSKMRATNLPTKLTTEELDDDPAKAIPTASPPEPTEIIEAALSPSTSPDFDSLPDIGEELSKDPHVELEYEELAELQGIEATPLGSRENFFRTDKRGLLVSIVVHSVLIGGLMAVTMRIPSEVASLGFESQSVDGDFESIEISQPIEVSPPELSPESPSEPTMSTPSSLPSTSSVLSSSASISQASASSSIASSLASSAGKAVTGGGKPSLSKVNASFFGAAAGGNSFCYVIDGSESMRGGPWEAAKRELLRSLSTLKENQRFYIIFFNRELNAISQPGEREPSPTALYATPENVQHAQNWVESLRIARGAPPDEALESAIELELDAIYFLADGATKSDVPSLLRTKNRTNDFISGEQIRVPIHAIAFYSPEVGQQLMQKIASENKGQFIYVPDPRKK